MGTIDAFLPRQRPVSRLAQGGTEMELSKLSVRAALTALALGLIQGCTALPQQSVAGDESFMEELTTEIYTTRVYMTGSRIPRNVDLRQSVGAQSAQPLKIVRIAK
jgi:hypothetical protein